MKSNQNYLQDIDTAGEGIKMAFTSVESLMTKVICFILTVQESKSDTFGPNRPREAVPDLCGPFFRWP